jgi:hypothetical protein
VGPYEPAAEGLDEIAELWERERPGPDEAFEMSAEIVAVEGDTTRLPLPPRQPSRPLPPLEQNRECRNRLHGAYTSRCVRLRP